ncbi:hypothetical protein JCM10449v2_001507 [Rhodotorula kratochvilovae]
MARASTASSSPPKRSPTKRTHPPAALDATAPADAASSRLSPLIRAADRDKLAVVVHDLAPALVLEQALSVPDAPGATLADALGESAPCVPLAVLRACINEASTSALLSSAMALDATEADSARLLNDVDDFQRTVLALLDELERGYASAAGVKREAEHDGAPAPPSKLRRYMLHRTLATGVDLFTSSALLSDADLAAVSSLEDTDVIAIHPSLLPAPAAPPPPALGEASPAPPAPQFAPHVPPAARFGRAPGLHGAMARQRLEAVEPTNPARQPTHLLSYPSPFLSSLAPTHDSAGATEPYSRSAARALQARRAGAWERAMAAPEEEEEEEMSLTEGERETLRELGVDADALLEALRAGSGEGTWKRLERNVELIARVGRAQVVRARRAARGEEEGGATKAGLREREDAAALLSSLASLLSAHASTRTRSSARTPSLLPPASLLRTLTPLLLAARAVEPAYQGTLDEANFRAVRDGQMGSALGAAREDGEGEGMGDLKVEG